MKTTSRAKTTIFSGAERPAIKVLLIEDNPADARLVQEFVRLQEIQPFEVEWVTTLEAGLEWAKRQAVDLVLLDLSLPDSRGFDTFARVKAQMPQTAIIVFSGFEDEALGIRTVQEGAQDYLIKGRVDGGLLVRAMRYAVERKRFREALTQERDLLHTLMDNMPDRIFFKDSRSRFTRVNRAVSQLFHLNSPEEAVGKSDFEFFTTEHALAAFNDEQRIMATGEPLVGKIEKEVFPDGRVNWAFTTKVPLRDPQGRIAGTFGISRDITAIKEMEDELIEERNLLRSLIDSSPDQVYAKDHTGRFVIASQAVADFFQVASPEELVGKTDFDLLPRGLAEQFQAEEQAILESGQSRINREAAVTDQDGHPRWVLTTKVPLRDSHGRIVGIVGLNRDITEHREAEEKLRHAAAIIASTDDAIVSTTLDGVIVSWNPGAEKVYGYSAAEMQGRPVASLSPPDRPGEVPQLLQKLKTGPGVEHFETVRLRKDGRPIHVSVTVSLVKNEAGQMAGTSAIVRDITERKQAEERLRQLNEELVASQAQLFHTVEALQRSNQELKTAHLHLIQVEKMEIVGRLAASVAHEVKNPLAIALLGVEYLAQGIRNDDPNVPMVLQEITGALGRADAIVRGLVDFSAATRLDLAETDLNGVIEGALLLYRYDLVRHNMAVARELAADLPPVNLDQPKMEQVFVNLISNAIHAMHSGGTLTLRTYTRPVTNVEPDQGDRTGQRLRVGDTAVVAEVDDTGGGIPAEHLSKVFEPFFTTKPTGMGTGLGLSVVKKIIELHGGTIEVRNRDEGGVRVAITLKAAAPVRSPQPELPPTGQH